MSPIVLLLLSPAVIGPVSTGLISAIKRIPVVSNVEDQGKRNLILRGLGALFALGGVVIAFTQTGIVPDMSQISDILITLVMVFSAFVGNFA